MAGYPNSSRRGPPHSLMPSPHEGEDSEPSPLGFSRGQVKTAWRGTCRRAGIGDLQVRDLRREFGSRLRESGASDHDVRDFLGHANITTTSRYLASTPLRLEKALANLESRRHIQRPSACRSAASNIVRSF